MVFERYVCPRLNLKMFHDLDYETRRDNGIKGMNRSSHVQVPRLEVLVQIDENTVPAVVQGVVCQYYDKSTKGCIARDEKPCDAAEGFQL